MSEKVLNNLIEEQEIIVENEQVEEQEVVLEETYKEMSPFQLI